MKKREAKRYVWAKLAAETSHHLTNESEWLYIFARSGQNFIAFNAADRRRIREAAREIATEMERRAGT